jgi:hypothetical protein
VLQSSVRDACIVILALNEPGRRRPTRTPTWPLRVSERPAASFACGGDGEELEGAIVRVLWGYCPGWVSNDVRAVEGVVAKVSVEPAQQQVATGARALFGHCSAQTMDCAPAGHPARRIILTLKR